MTTTKIFYGWTIVLVSSVVDFIAVGFFFYSYGAFFLPIAQELGGGTRLGVSVGITLVNVTSATIAPYTGNLLDSLSIRRMMMAGIVIASVGFFLLAQVRSMLQFYLVITTLIAIGTSTMGQISTAKLVTNWFVNKRGTALGIATAGISLAGVIMPPITTWLIIQFGWRGTLETFSVITFVLLAPVVWFFVVDRPEDKGQEPDGVPRLPLDGVALKKPLSVRARWQDIMRMKLFWALSLNFGLNFCVVGATLVLLMPLAQDMGLSKYTASAILSAGALFGVLGKLVCGRLADRSSLRVALQSSIFFQALGIALILFSHSMYPLLIGSIIFGFGMGAGIPLQGTIVSAQFGRDDFGKAMGLMRPVMMPFQILGGLLAGWLYDVQGNYNLVLSIFIVFCMISYGLTYKSLPKPAA